MFTAYPLPDHSPPYTGIDAATVLVSKLQLESNSGTLLSPRDAWPESGFHRCDGLSESTPEPLNSVQAAKTTRGMTYHVLGVNYVSLC